KDGSTCHATGCRARKDTLSQSCTRAERNEASGHPFRARSDACNGTTREVNGFTRLKPFTHHRHGAAAYRIKRSAIEENPGVILISSWRGTCIGAFFETHACHDSPWRSRHG